LFDDRGNMTGCIESARDVTELRRSEQEQARLKEMLFQSQKMETVGLLAGGIAHDFNNLLTPILGYSDLMLMGLPDDDPKRQMLEQVRICSERARDLTKRLLAFSRKQSLELKELSPGEIVKEFMPVLKSVIRENILISLNIDGDGGFVMADRGQIEQALLNLAVNAVDAMPDGGLITIEVRNFEVDESYVCSHIEISPGPFVMLSVSDTGVGMEGDMQDHIFDPFFTTKEVGRGTGLGLATVYGIVKQHGGTVSVYSEKGKGSTFRILLPRLVREADRQGAPAPGEEEIMRGSETVLVMEDDETVRGFTCKILTDLGYNVLAAGNTEDCIETARSHDGAIDLLLTDVIMPEKNGPELYNAVRQYRPDIGVLFMSGYAGNVIRHHGIADAGLDFLQKPFSIRDLSRKVRRAIDLRRGSAVKGQ
jgi:nitrogen-specific signal transduction histidine kinase/CheY-like chemotaxis protein